MVKQGKSLLLLLLISILIISLSFCTNYSESKEHFKKRLKFQSNLMRACSNYNVVVKHSEEKGMYCYAKEDIPKAPRPIFSVPQKYIISSCNYTLKIIIVDTFPFKFELFEAVIDYFKNRKYPQLSFTDISKILFSSLKYSNLAFLLMFIKK